MAKVGGRVAVPEEERLARGDRLKVLRKRIDFTQDALAERGGFPRADVSRFEKGEKLSSEANRRKLAEAFGLSLEMLGRYIDGTIDVSMALHERDQFLANASVWKAWQPATVLEPRYAVLNEVLEVAAHRGRWSKPTIAAAREMALDADEDLDAGAWVQLLDRLDAAISVSVAKLPSRGAGPLDGIDERVRPARKKL